MTSVNRHPDLTDAVEKPLDEMGKTSMWSIRRTLGLTRLPLRGTEGV